MISSLTAGTHAPNEVRVLIEIPQGSRLKLELSKKNGLLEVDRYISTSMPYPANYGYIPGTLGDDGDPTDALVWFPTPLPPGVLLYARPVGLLVMEDENGPDEKVLAVPPDRITTRYKDIKDMEDLPLAEREEVSHFFAHYKELEKGKWVKIQGFESKAKALALITRHLAQYTS